MDCALEESDARALRDLGAFVNTEHSSVPCFYSCEIDSPAFRITQERPSYTISLQRRGSLAIQSECHNLDKSPVFLIGAVNLLKAIRILVSCRTLTDAQFSILDYGACWRPDWVPTRFEDLMSEVFTLLRSSPSLSCFHFINSVTDASLYCKHLQTLVCENPRLESLTVLAGGLRLVVLAEAIAACLSRNTVLNSFTFVSRSLGHVRSFGRALASAMQSNTSLKHVQCIYECDGNGTYMDGVKYITDKNLCQAELQIQEILRTMIDNGLRVNTSLESLTVGHWTLLRVGTEWQTSYRGPCQREQTGEYIVKVKLTR